MHDRFAVSGSARVTILPLVAALTIAAALAACSPPDEGAGDGGDGGGGTGQTHIVHLSDFAFDTEQLEIAAGDTVRFVNDDADPHTATHGSNGEAADPAAFDIELAAAGEEGAEGETEPLDEGTYSVTCRLHPDMNMTIVVAPAE